MCKNLRREKKEREKCISQNKLPNQTKRSRISTVDLKVQNKKCNSGEKAMTCPKNLKLTFFSNENLRKTFFVLVVFSIIRALCRIRNLPIYDRQISGSGINSLHAGFINCSCSPIWFNFILNKKFSLDTLVLVEMVFSYLGLMIIERY